MASLTHRTMQEIGLLALGSAELRETLWSVQAPGLLPHPVSWQALSRLLQFLSLPSLFFLLLPHPLHFRFLIYQMSW